MERTRRKHEGQLCHDVFRRNSILLRSSPSHLLLVFLPSVISLLQTQIFHSCRGSQKASATTTRLQDAPAREIKILPVGDISPHEMASGMSSFLFLSPILHPPELPPISMQKGLRVTIAKGEPYITAGNPYTHTQTNAHHSTQTVTPPPPPPQQEPSTVIPSPSFSVSSTALI